MKQLNILLPVKGAGMLLLTFLLVLLPSAINAMTTDVVGNMKKTIVDGIEWTYTVLNEEEKTCEVGGVALDEYGEETGIAAISESTTGNVTIPSMLDGYAVVGICYSAFREIPISEVVIPAGVKSIGEKAFMQCGSLTSVTLPEGLTFIGEEAFSESAISNITLPESLVRIGEQAFEQTLLTTIALPVNVKYLGNEDRVSETGDVIEEDDLYGDVFNGCELLRAVIVAEGNTAYASVDGMLLTKDKKTLLFSPVACQATVVPQGVECIYESAFYKSLLTSITLPSSLNEIGRRAFYGCDNLNEVVSYIEEPFEIAEGTFGYDISATLYVPAGTKEKYEATPAWNQFQNIEEIENMNQNIVFADAAVKAICVANWDTNGDGELSYAEAAAVTGLGESFKDNSEIASFDELQYFTGLTSIGDAAFNGCSGLTSVTISESVTSIGSRAFQGCAGLTSVTIPESVTSIGAWAFQNCTGLTSITIPKDLTSISMGMFCDCSGLTSVTIPEGVTSIGYYVFEGCAGLTSVTIPSSVTNINPFAFARCLGLTSVTSLVQEPFEIYSSVFNEIDWTTVTLYVPAGTKEKYEATPAWNQFQNIVEIENMNQNIVFADAAVKAICVANWDTNGDGELSYAEAAAVTRLGQVFQLNTEITSFDELQYFTGLTSIGDGAFYACSSLTSVAIPEGVTSIGSQAFQYCTGLTSIIIPEGVTSIGSGAFANCESLTSVTIPEGVTNIGVEAFSFCSGLTSVTVASGNSVYDSREGCNAIIKTNTNTLIFGCQNTIIPNSVTSIGNEAFFFCTGLTSLTIPSSVTSIGDWAFRECSGLKSVTFHEGLINIGQMAFAYCESLTSINIPSSVTNIDDTAFGGCSGLTSVTIPEGVTYISDRVFWQCTGLKSVTIPSSVTSIGRSAFNTCSSLTSVTFSEGLMTIGEYAFGACRNLTSVNIPSSVTSIGKAAFGGCPNLTKVTSLIKEPFVIDSTVFSDWNDETEQDDFTSATLYVPAGTKEKYEATPAWNQFQNIVEMGIEPVDQGEAIDFGNEIDENTNLNGTVVDNVLVNISNDNGGYDPVEGCIVVNTPTDDSSINGQDIFGDDFKDNYTGIVFKVAPGSGSIKVEAQTTGNMVLKVKIGEGMPITMELEGKLKVTFPYNVTEETNVYVYGGMNTAGAKPFGIKGANSSDSSLKIYSIEVDSNSTGIDGVDAENDSSADAPVYNLNGQRVNNVGKGIYIKNGQKVLVK